MKKNYLTYPVKTMNITQNYLGKTSHLTHTVGTPKDYPFDEAGENSGREYLYCPCDEMKITRLYGVGNGGTNTLWLESTDKVYFADGTSNYFTLMVIHPNDDDLKRLSVGQSFKRNEPICREGTDGNATGNHLHLSGGKGTMRGIGWALNSKKVWVLIVTGRTAKPESLFYVDKSFTKIKNSGGLEFKYLPEDKRVAEKETGEYTVTASLLNVRKGPGTSYDALKFEDLTRSAQQQILKLSGKKRDGYVKGVEFTAKKIKNGWAETPSGWVSLKYCRKK